MSPMITKSFACQTFTTAAAPDITCPAPRARVLSKHFNAEPRGLRFEARRHSRDEHHHCAATNATQLLTERLLESDRFAERRGAAWGLAGAVKGMGLPSLGKYKVMDTLKAAVEAKGNTHAREGALMAIECFYMVLGRLFEPYIVSILPLLLSCASDGSNAVREATSRASRVIMSKLSVHGVKMVMPNLLKTIEEKSWRTRVASIDLLGAMAHCAPKQLSQCLPQIVPSLQDCFADTHPKVQVAVKEALNSVGSVIKSPEIASLVPQLLAALEDPAKRTSAALNALMETAFVNCVDSPSLALIVPILRRGLREGGMDTKRRTAQVVGSMCSLITSAKDILPYLPTLLPPLKDVLVDPIPEVRAVAAKAMGTLMDGLGEENLDDIVPWLKQTMRKNPGLQVERLGAAQGLVEVVRALGVGRLREMMPEVINNTYSDAPEIREGAFGVLLYGPQVFAEDYEGFIEETLPALLEGMADEHESVREVALKAGRTMVQLFAFTALDAILPTLLGGLFNEGWLIRQSSVLLLGNLLFRIVGASGKAMLGGDTDEGISTEAQNQQIIDTLGKGRRDDVLACLFILRSDGHVNVRNESLHVWKTVVMNTRATLLDVLPSLIDRVINCLANPDPNRRQVAGEALGDVVRRLGDKVLPLLMPILERGLQAESSDTRQGVCLGLSELVKAAAVEQIEEYLETILPAVRTALCDPNDEVRGAAAESFNSLSRSAGQRVVEEIVPLILDDLSSPDTNAAALHGLAEILRLRSTVVFPYLIPRLAGAELTTVGVEALAAVAHVSEPPLSRYLDKIMPRLFNGAHQAEQDGDEERGQACVAAASAVVLAVGNGGIQLLVGQLQEASRHSMPHMRRMMAQMVESLCKSDADWQSDFDSLLERCLEMFADDDDAVVQAAIGAVTALVELIEKDDMHAHMDIVRDSLTAARSTAMGRSASRSETEVPGLCVPAGLKPVLPIYLHCLMSSGQTKVREGAATGIGELVMMTNPTALRKYVLQMTGPLIRIFGERCPPEVKVAILGSLTLLLEKGGILLKPFLPQLQPTFLKATRDPTKNVRRGGVAALEKLVKLMTRFDPLMNELLKEGQNNESEDVRCTMFIALQRVFGAVGAKLKPEVVMSVATRLADMGVLTVLSVDDGPREAWGIALGTVSAYITDMAELTPLLEANVLQVEGMEGWQQRHGQSLALLGLVSHLPPAALALMGNKLVDTIVGLMSDDKLAVRQAAIRSAGTLLSRLPADGVAVTRTDAAEMLMPSLLSIISGPLSADGSALELAVTAIKGIKDVAKESPDILSAHLTALAQALLAQVKKATARLRGTIERCMVRMFELEGGKSERLSAYLAQCSDDDRAAMETYARKTLSKLEVDSDSDDDDEDEKPEWMI